jgi:osmotically-inducible protein OsmY
VEVKKGTVFLSGLVGSPAEKSQARMAAWIQGTRDVDASRLKVEPLIRDNHQRLDAIEPRSDEAIKAALVDAYSYDPRLYGFEIDPHVESGWVTLRGKVDNLRAKEAVVGIANLTVGVTGVTDRIKIRPGVTRSDADLESAIQTKLAQDPWLLTEKIEYSVHDGIARVGGMVYSQFAKMRCEVLVNSIEGIKEVENMIQVTDGGSILLNDPYVWDHTLYPWNESESQASKLSHVSGLTLKDKELADRIAMRLFWSPFVNHQGITVFVENGVATLDGEVSSRLAKQTALSKAIMAGALRVENNLIVEG